MAYDADAVWAEFHPKWHKDNEQNLSVLPYPPKYRGPNDVTHFILAVKRGEPKAISIAAEMIVRTIRQCSNVLCRECRYILTIPGHLQDSRNTACEAICQVVARRFPWLEHLDHGLRRIESVTKSAFAGPGNRPTYDDHRRTIRYNGPQGVLKNRGVILLDDVYTLGSTSDACRDILRAAGAQTVVGLFIGRTV